MEDNSSIREMLAQALREVAATLQSGGVERLEMLKRKELLSPSEVEELYGLKAATLADKRCRGHGPDYVKLGGEKGAVFYRHADLERWIKSNKRLGSYER